MNDFDGVLPETTAKLLATSPNVALGDPGGIRSFPKVQVISPKSDRQVAPGAELRPKSDPSGSMWANFSLKVSNILPTSTKVGRSCQHVADLG